MKEGVVMSVETNGRRISRDEVQAALAKVLGQGQDAVQAKLPAAAIVGGAVVVGVLALAYWFGRRGGRRDSAVLEIRRL
jgi:hypothetical protein